MGAMRLGRFIEFIPHPVTTGFTAGIAVVIATLQLMDAFGLTIARQPDPYFEKVAQLWNARHEASLAELGVAALTLVILLLWPRVSKTLPAPLVALVLVSVGAALLVRAFPASRGDSSARLSHDRRWS